MSFTERSRPSSYIKVHARFGQTLQNKVHYFSMTVSKFSLCSDFALATFCGNGRKMQSF